MKLWLETTQILSSFFSLSLFTFAFFFSLLGLCVEEMWVLGSRFDIVPIVWVLFNLLFTNQKLSSKFGFQTRIWVRIKKRKKRKRKRKGIVNWVKNCELWVMRMKNWDMDVLRTKHRINFQIFDHTSICPIWALNESFFYCDDPSLLIIRSDSVKPILGMWPKHSLIYLITS